MCGIVGFVGPPRPDVLSRAVDTIAHRGPDGRGCYEDAHLSIGHCRLSIIDLATGQQPMQSSDRRYVIAFNGEIYNFPELRRILSREGHLFRTTSDTEVLLQWLASRWRDGLSDLNGMFAFALWDRHEKRLLLGRDRLGIKPLYIFERGDAFAFSSEIKAMLPMSGSREPNLQSIFQFLTFQNVLTEQTFFKDVTKLQPGGWLEWTPAGITRGRFWSVRFRYSNGLNFNEIVDRYRQTLDRAVERHMIADVPVGTYLSGGIDSSSVTAVAARRTNAELHTFTGAFVDAPYYDERSGSRAVANQVRANLHEIEIREEDFCNAFGKVVYHLDEPTLGTGALPQFMVAQLAARHVKVVLTGHGGDETFAGYQVSKAVLLRQLLRTRPLAALQQLARVTSDELTRVLYFTLFPLVQPEVGHGLFIMTPRKRRTRQLAGSFLDAVGDYEPLDEIDTLIDRSMTPGEALQTLYLKTYLPTLFIQEDKIGMAHSLEARMPLCDNEMIDLALSINFEDKLHHGTLKAIPKAAMRGELPNVLYTLPKRGFPTPFARWFKKGPVRQIIEELLLSPRARERGIFEPTYVSRLFGEHVKSRTDTLRDYARASELYSIAIVELWFRTYIDQLVPCPIE